MLASLGYTPLVAATPRDALAVLARPAVAVDLLLTAFQAESMFRRNRRLVVFDMDSTLLKIEVIDELAKARGVGPEVVAITESAMRGDLDFAQSFTQRLSLLKGLTEEQVKNIGESLPLTDGAERLISTLKKSK